nr:MmcQ/YjbR family DNA-binding protein [uncultured Flavobacterium sp.]
MQLDQFYEFCLNLKGTTEHFPFDEDTLAFKVGGKMYALASLSEWENGTPKVNLKCDPDRAVELRESYSGIEAGYHMNKKHWNTVKIHEDVPMVLLHELIQHSYDLVFKSLSKKVQGEILI